MSESNEPASSLAERAARLITRWADGTTPNGAMENVAAAGLRAASLPYRVGAALRGATYDAGIAATYEAGCPVISIGNLSAGGTGKTPVVIETATLLREAGVRVVVVSRGYGREGGERATRIVSDGEQVLLSPAKSGDEPWVMANRLAGVPVVVGGDRVDAARMAVRDCGAQAIVLDDGFQHRRLERDCDIVLWDALRPASAAALLPRGLLREGLRALKRAHAVLFTRCNLATDSLKTIKRRMKRIAPHLVMFETGLCPVSLIEIGRGETPYEPETLREKRVVAFCGLGNPQSFWRMLEAEGIRPVGQVALPDHHRATPDTVQSIWQRFADEKPDCILTTEKDLADLPHDFEPPAPLFAIRIRVDFGDDASRFRQFILEATRNHPSA